MKKLIVWTPLAPASAMVLLMLALPSMAQDGAAPIARVEVRHHVKVTDACPSVLEQLPQDLAAAWNNIDAPSEVLVDFKLNGSRVDEVKTKGGLPDYHAPIRRAVRNLSCHTPDGGSYSVRFLVKFVYPDEPGLSRVSIRHRQEAAKQPVLAMEE